MLQVSGTNPGGEEVAEAIEDVVAQVVVVGGVVAIEVPDRRATRIDRRAVQTKLRSQG